MTKQGEYKTMYVQKTIRSGNVTEVEKYQTAKYKAKKTKRQQKKTTTPEHMAKNNAIRAAKALARLINTNFVYGDLLVTLTYNPPQRPLTTDDAKNHISKFLRKLKNMFRRNDITCKYVGVSDFGNGITPHHHILIPCGLTLTNLQSLWPNGHVNIETLDSSGDYTKIANYLLKHTDKVYNDPTKRVHAKRFFRSRNLKEPEVTIEIVNSDSWRENPKAPKGYYLVKDSVTSFISPTTGYPYQYYKCISLSTLTPNQSFKFPMLI